MADPPPSPFMPVPGSGFSHSDFNSPVVSPSESDSIAYSESSQLESASAFPFNSYPAHTTNNNNNNNNYHHTAAASRWYTDTSYSLNGSLQTPAFDASNVPVNTVVPYHHQQQQPTNLDAWTAPAALQPVDVSPIWTAPTRLQQDPFTALQQTRPSLDSRLSSAPTLVDDLERNFNNLQRSTSDSKPSSFEDTLSSSDAATTAGPSPTTTTSSAIKPEPCQPAPAVKRKRGRPRIIRNESSDGPDQTKAAKPTRISKRLPHNQVERKYREGLNAEMERLRAAIPTLPQDATLGAPKPSKATVLQCAVDEINKVREEKAKLETAYMKLVCERDEAVNELDRYRRREAQALGMGNVIHST